MRPQEASVAQTPVDAQEQPIVHRRPTTVSILWRVFTVNAIVFGLAVFVLIASPATVSNPIKRSELVALIGGLVVTLAIDLLLLRLVLSPLRRLATLMGAIAPMLRKACANRRAFANLATCVGSPPPSPENLRGPARTISPFDHP